MSNRGSGPSTYDYTYCLDSENRDKIQSPDTNDILLNIDGSNMRRGAVQIYVGSAELPAPQYTIEDTWRNICFDEGFRIDSFTGGHSFIATDSQAVDHTVVIPMWLNPVVSVVGAAGAVTITTQFPHALALRNLWDPANPVVSRFPISWVSSGSNDPAITTLSGNPAVTVLTPTTFTITTVDFALPFADGYIHAPAVDSPVALAVLLNNALILAGFTEGTFDYDLEESVFIFRTIYTGTTRPAEICLTPLTGGNEVGLLQCMGFIPCCTNNSAICSLIYIKRVNRWGLLAEGGPGWRASIGLTTGMYLDMGLLGSDMVLQYNRLYFDSMAGVPTPPTNDILLFSTQLGVYVPVPILWGQYYPDTMASYLQTRMNALDPLATYTVTFTPDTVHATGGCGQTSGVFTFGSTHEFGLEFGDASAGYSSTVASRLGFANFPYRNGTSYSGKSLVFPTLGCQFPYSPHLQVNLQALTARRHFRFDPTLPRLIATPGTTFVDVAAYGPPLVITSTDLSPGFQVNDVVVVSFPDSLNPDRLAYLARVAAVGPYVAGVGFTFTLDLDPVTSMIPPAPPQRVVVGLFQDSTTFNIYFNSPSKTTNTSRFKMNTIKPPILGFNFTDLMAPAPFESISPVALEPPPYLLLQITDTKGSSYIQHNYHGDNLTNLLAKIIFFPTYQMQRLYPMQLTFNGSEILTQLRFRWLTPDHELYQFHGRNWSITLQVVIPGDVPYLMCS